MAKDLLEEEKPKLLDLLTDNAIETEGLLPGQTPLRDERLSLGGRKTSKYKDTVQGKRIDWDAWNKAPKDRKNFYFVKPEDVPTVIRRQYKNYISNPRGYGLTENSTLEDVVGKFDQERPENKTKKLKSQGIDLKTKIKDLKNSFDLSKFNPFAATEANAAEEPRDLLAETEEPESGRDLLADVETPNDPRAGLTTTQKILTSKPAQAVFGVIDKIKENEIADVISTHFVKESPAGVYQRIHDAKPYLTEEEERLSAKHPVASTVGGMAGGLLTVGLATAIPGVGLPIAFGASGALGKIAEQSEQPLPEDSLGVARQIGQVAVTGVAQGITGKIFSQAQAGKTILDRLLMRSSGAGANAITESIANDAIANEKPDVKKAIINGGMTAVQIGILGAVTEIPQLRGLIIKEAKNLTGKQLPIDEAKAVIKKAGINPEALSPEFQRAQYEIKRQAALDNIALKAKYLKVPESIIREVINARDVRSRDEILSKYLTSLVKTNPSQAEKLLPFYDMIKKGADPVDILIAQELQAKLKPTTQIEETIKAKEIKVEAEPFEGEMPATMATKEGKELPAKFETKKFPEEAPIVQPSEDSQGKQGIVEAKQKQLYRGGPESEMPRGLTAADVIKYEQEELGNKDVVVEKGIDTAKIKSENLVWLTETEEQATEYGEALPSDIKNYRVIARDSEGGVLVEKLKEIANVSPFTAEGKGEAQEVKVNPEEIDSWIEQQPSTIDFFAFKDKFGFNSNDEVQKQIDASRKRLSAKYKDIANEWQETYKKEETETKQQPKTVEDVKKIVQEKIKATSKSVRDNTQSVTIQGDKITVVNNVGRKKLGSFDIDVKKWEELENSFGNPNYNKKQYIKELNKKAFPGNYSGEMENEPIISRVEDAQISAINEAYRKYKSEPTAVKEQPKTAEDVKRIVEKKKAKPITEQSPKETLTKPVESAIPKIEEKSDALRQEREISSTSEEAKQADSIDGGAVRGDDVRERTRPGGQRTVESEPEPSRPSEVSESTQEPLEAKPTNYKITESDNIGSGGIKAKYKDNIAAIKLIKKLKEENRLATDEEKKILVKYVGWGGLSQAFDSYNTEWEKEYKELKGLFSEEDYRTARASTTNAHYTAQDIILKMWDAVNNMGFKTGRVLEPACGVGHFVGLAPQNGKSFSLVELDNTTGEIAKNLYQASSVQVKGFQDAALPANFFDVAISNVPFADVKIYDPKAKQLGIPENLSIHNYFFAKSLALVKPGGVVAFITSRYTLDSQNDIFRNWMNRNAKLLGAIRLPSDAFKKNAGTQVVTDIIFLQKPVAGEKIENPKFIIGQNVFKEGNAFNLKMNELKAKYKVNTNEELYEKINSREETELTEADEEETGETIYMNEYFAEHPEMVIGNPALDRGMYSSNELVVKSTDTFNEDLANAINSLPKDIMGKNDKGKDVTDAGTIDDHTKVKKYSYVQKSGKLYQNGESGLEEVVAGPDNQKIVDYIKIRDSVRDLLSLERTNAPDKEIEAMRKSLNTSYDAFVRKHGYLNEDKNEDAFGDDPDAPLVSSLEVEITTGKKTTYKKNVIFKERIIKPHVKPTSAKNIKDAVNISLGEYGKLDFKYIGELLGKKESDVEKDIVQEKIAFTDPISGEIVLSDEYLSGNVKKKLVEAKEALKTESKFANNVSELEKVQPKDLEFTEIKVKAGMPWIRPETYNEFFKAIGVRDKKIVHSPIDGSWRTEKRTGYYGYGYGSTMEEYGTSRLDAAEIFLKVMNGKPLKVFDKREDFDPEGNRKEVKILNEEETAAAEAKGELIKEKFSSWFWEDDNRREVYTKLYNEEWNTTVVRKYDGSHLVFPSMNMKAFPNGLRKTQLDAIWRGIQSNSLMLAHSVGAGKTAIMTSIAVESKRLGLINKVMVVAPKNTIPGWRNQIGNIYPSAKVLVANEKNFELKKRKKFLAKIATGDWDIIVIPERSFEQIMVSPEAFKEYTEKQLDELRAYKDELKSGGSRISVKNIENSIAKLQEKLREILDQSKKDDLLYFEELGIDSVFVDEADKFKNLAYQTQKEDIKGMGSQEGSNKSADLMMKLNILRKGKGKIVFATGTPISNSMVEAYSMMKYLQPEMLETNGIKNFDDWANTFGEVDTRSEIDVTGGRYKLVSRFAKFVNVPELMKMIRSVWDIQTQDMLLKQGVLVRDGKGSSNSLPLIKTGKPEAIVVENTPELQAYTASLIDRAKEIENRKGKVQKGDDILLNVLRDGRAAAVDIRNIDPTAKPKTSKVEVAIKGILEEYKATSNINGTQVIFIDQVAPDKTAAFNPHYYMKNKLVEGGIPAKEIAFIHDFDKEEQKIDLYEKVNKGEIRVLFGSTEKLGAGTNIQKRLSKLWNLDSPWRPRDITQREGRIDRPGNINNEISMVRLAQKGSLDTFMYNLLEAKAKSIEMLMQGEENVREAAEEDVNEYEMLKALSSENPMVKEKADIDREVRKLQALQMSNIKERDAANKVLKNNPPAIESLNKDIVIYEEFKKTRPEKPKTEDFKITVKDKEYNIKKDAHVALFQAFTSINFMEKVQIGEYLGYKLFGNKIDKGPSGISYGLSILIDPTKKIFLDSYYSNDPVGTFVSIDSSFFGELKYQIDTAKSLIERYSQEINSANAILSKGFQKKEELEQKVKRQKELEIALRKETTKDVEKRIQGEGTEGTEYAYTFPALPQSAKKPVNDSISGVAFSNPEVEKRYNESRGLVTPGGLKQKVSDFLDTFWKRATRVYPELPNDPKFASLRNLLGKVANAKMVSKDRSLRNIDAITAGFGPKKLDLFTRKVILDDLIAEAQAGHALPFGYSYVQDGEVITDTEALNKDLYTIDAIIEQNEDIKKAVEMRSELWSAITSDLIRYDILKEEQVKSGYFRHQILEYANAKSQFGPGKKLRKPRPGYAKRRGGSTFDINTDYLQVETEIMAQALNDIEMAKALEFIEGSDLNIAPKLKAEAKKLNKDAEEKTDWRELLPEGYALWQPEKGNIFFSATSIPEKIIDEILVNESAEISKDDLKKVLAIGRKKKELALPEEAAKTLDALYEQKNPNFVTAAAKAITTTWKKWVLLNPRRAVKYNLQNFTGDFDALIAGDPRALKYFGQANQELTDMFYKGKPMTEDLRDFFERGGFSSQLTFQEIPSINQLEMFNRFMQKDNLPDKLNFAKRYWNMVTKFTNYRESIMRYAAYLHYKNLLDTGNLKNYAASNRREIDALTNNRDKAAKLATELLGDYANISALGKDLRETTIPFYSWLEVNIKRYNRLFRNAFNEGVGPGTRVSATMAAKGGVFLTKFMLRTILLTSLIALYNNLRYPDEEEELSEYDKNRMHINLGRDKDGNIRIIRAQGAFADLIEWVGLDSVPQLWREYFEGKASLGDLFGTIPKTDIPAFGLNPFEGKIGLHPVMMKFLRGITPLYKLPVETLTGKSIPVFDDASWKVDDKMRNVLKAISLENEYDFATKKPSRGYINSLASALITTQDPLENAYRYIQGEKYKFLETVKGRGGSGDYYSPRSLLIREYKKALRYKDKGAEQRALQKIREFGITNKEIDESMERADPLYGLSKKDKAEFENHYLSQYDREKFLGKARAYYERTFKRR